MSKLRIALFIFSVFWCFSILVSSVSLAEEKKSCHDSKQTYSLIGEMNIDFFSRYVGASGIVAYRNPVVQGSYGLNLEPTGLYVKFWGSGGLNGEDRNPFGNELNWIAGIRRDVFGFVVDAGYAYYDISPLRNVGGDLHALRGKISFPTRILTPYVNLEFNIPVNKKSLEGGFTYRFGVLKPFKIRENLSLILDLSLAGHDGAFGFRPEPISSLKGGLGLHWSPWKDFSIGPQVMYQKGLGYHPSHGGIASDVFCFGVTFTWRHKLLSF